MKAALLWLLTGAAFLAAGAFVGLSLRLPRERLPGASRAAVLLTTRRWFDPGLYTPVGNRLRRGAVMAGVATAGLAVAALAVQELL